MIRAHELSRVYQTPAGPLIAVDQVSLDVAPGERLAILGRSGSGKSTLLHLLAGLDLPTHGQLQIARLDLCRMSPAERASFRARTVAMVFQAFHLVPTLSALENVELPLTFAGIHRSQRSRRATETLARVGLEHRLGHRPAQLSGGEQQRVAIARALVTSPQLLLADEPTGNLDSETAGEVTSLLDRIATEQQLTVVLVTHDQQLARSFAQRVVSMQDGQLTSDSREATRAAQ